MTISSVYSLLNQFPETSVLSCAQDVFLSHPWPLNVTRCPPEFLKDFLLSYSILPVRSVLFVEPNITNKTFASGGFAQNDLYISVGGWQDYWYWWISRCLARFLDLLRSKLNFWLGLNGGRNPPCFDNMHFHVSLLECKCNVAFTLNVQKQLNGRASYMDAKSPLECCLSGGELVGGVTSSWACVPY